MIVSRWEGTGPSFSHTPTLTRVCSGGPGQVLQPREWKNTVKISDLPLLGTGNTVIEAVKVLVEHGVQPSVIILLSLFSTPHCESRGCQGTQEPARVCLVGKSDTSYALRTVQGTCSFANNDNNLRREGRFCFWIIKLRVNSKGFGVGQQEGEGVLTPNGKTANGQAYLKAGICSAARYTKRFMQRRTNGGRCCHCSGPSQPVAGAELFRHQKITSSVGNMRSMKLQNRPVCMLQSWTCAGRSKKGTSVSVK